jgi:hypothetical protein
MGSHSPFPHSGHGGKCFVEPTSIAWLQFVQRYVPAETSLPAGTGFAMRPPFLPLQYAGRIPEAKSPNLPEFRRSLVRQLGRGLAKEILLNEAALEQGRTSSTLTT